jgi:hypothetical protein
MTFTLRQINSNGDTSGPKAVDRPFASVYNDQQHFGYRDAAGGIWDSWYNPQNNTWALQQINGNQRTKGPPAASGPCIGVYQNQQHFAYVDAVGTIWDSWYDGNHNTWKLQQINNGGLTKGPTASPYHVAGTLGSVGIWVDPSNTQQHFTYLGTDSVIYDAFWDSNANSWKLQKLTGGGLTNGPAGSGCPFGCVYHSQQHIAYLDKTGTINDAWYDGNGRWGLQKIGSQAAASTQPFVWVDPTDTQQHFTYLGPDAGVYDAFWDSTKNAWQAQKINVGGNTTGPAAVGMPTACVFGKEEHVAYLDSGGNVWDSWRDVNGTWNLQQVHIGPAATAPVFIWTSNTSGSQLHFTYRDGSGVIWDSVFVEGAVGTSVGERKTVVEVR